MIFHTRLSSTYLATGTSWSLTNQNTFPFTFVSFFMSEILYLCNKYPVIIPSYYVKKMRISKTIRICNISQQEIVGKIE